jgi:hypothetical protein
MNCEGMGVSLLFLCHGHKKYDAMKSFSLYIFLIFTYKHFLTMKISCRTGLQTKRLGANDFYVVGNFHKQAQPHTHIIKSKLASICSA